MPRARSVPFTALACAFALAGCVHSPPLPPIPRRVDPMTLWTGGTALRGANIYQRRVYPAIDHGALGPGPVGPPYTVDDFRHLAALGANYVHISSPGVFREDPPYAPDPAVIAHLDSLIAEITEAGMYVVIAFRTGPGRSEFTFFRGHWFDPGLVNDDVWRDPAAQRAWAAMWRFTAARYRGVPGVVGYDLMVEPNGAKRMLGVWKPEDFYPAHRSSLEDWNPMARRLTRAVREVDPDTPILVSPMGYASIRWLPYLEPTGDPRTVYTVHQYAPNAYTGQPDDAPVTYPDDIDVDGDGRTDAFNRAWLTSLIGTVTAYRREHDVPVAVTEFGVRRWLPDARAFLGDEISLFESAGMSWALWMWNPRWPPMRTHDAYDVQRSTDPDWHHDVLDSRLFALVQTAWDRNTVHPVAARIELPPVPRVTVVARTAEHEGVSAVVEPKARR